MFFSARYAHRLAAFFPARYAHRLAAFFPARYAHRLAAIDSAGKDTAFFRHTQIKMQKITRESDFFDL